MKTKKPLIISLLGKSGSGKGTQANFLIKKFGLKHLGSGNLLRARSKVSDFTGKKLTVMLKKGGLAPTPVIFDLWVSEVEKLKNNNVQKVVALLFLMVSLGLVVYRIKLNK